MQIVCVREKRPCSLRWTVAMSTLLLLLSMSMIACWPKPELRPVSLGKSEIKKNDDGTFTVSAGWMARRVRYERALLKQCPDR